MATRQIEHVPRSDEDILAMNPVDLQLCEEVAAVRAAYHQTENRIHV